MAHYKQKENKSSKDDFDCGSEYESDGETEYSPVKSLGQGYYAKARLFQSTSKKSVVVLNPVESPADIGEAVIKYRFFKAMYPETKSHLFPLHTKKENDYRLVIPYIPYVPYEKLLINTPKFQKILFHSTIQALKECHEKGIIVLDLKSDNIYYDSSQQKSFLIDGGLSAPEGSIIDPLTFQKLDQATIEQCKKDYWQIPPECWSIKPTTVLANPKMDIYSLGVLMHDLFTTPDSQIQSLIDHCLEKDPEKRPTLVELITSLNANQETDKIDKVLHF